MIKHHLKHIFILLSILLFGCVEEKEYFDNPIIESKTTHLILTPIFGNINPQPSKTRISHGIVGDNDFQDGDSLLLVNISNGFHSKMLYNSELGAFEGDALLHKNDEISVVYPYKDLPINNNRILLDALFQNGYDVNNYHWGITTTNEVDSCTRFSIKLFNLCNTCSVDVVDEDDNPIAVKSLSLSALKGKLYKSRFLNIKTGSWEEGTYAETLNIGGDTIFSDGRIQLSLIPTYVLIKGYVVDFKDNSFEGKAEQQIFSENDSSYLRISCTTPASAKEYVVVCGIKWAKGNLQYAGDEDGAIGFQLHWRLDSTQYEYFNPVYGMQGTPLAEDLPYDTIHVDVFNWGTCGENALDITKYGTKSNTDISGKMYTDKYLRCETTDFEKALFGDIVYWASNGKWRMPNIEELYTLFNVASYSCGYVCTPEGELVFGFYFTTPVGNRITDTDTIRYYTQEELDNGLFLPGSGYRQKSVPYLKRVGKCGFYWDSNQGEGSEHMCIRFISNKIFWSGDGPTYGRSIRPVLSE
ncbi:MAG: hypothetical protein LUD00_04950 [Prevotellaceae bacterium]|nr:hypothetical protein [Prevotellaceae bacterium]